jgi:hypothetical protein
MVVSFYYLFNTLGPETFGPYYVLTSEQPHRLQMCALCAAIVPKHTYNIYYSNQC